VIEATERNTGTVTIKQPAVQLQALQDGKFSRDLKVFSGDDLAPGASRSVSWSPTLPDGRYVIDGQVLVGTQSIADARAQLTVGAVAAAGFAKLGRGLAVVALILLVIAAIVVVLFLRKRRTT
jgi:hypothetical protein